MSVTMSISQAATRLPELVRSLGPNDEIVLTDDDQPVARIVASAQRRGRRRAGSCKGMLIVNREDDEHLNDFEEYMP
jgi:antitoxin (DNA-binding transcriptional repressor) of toxin-antitoxin stability system